MRAWTGTVDRTAHDFSSRWSTCRCLDLLREGDGFVLPLASNVLLRSESVVCQIVSPCFTMRSPRQPSRTILFCKIPVDYHATWYSCAALQTIATFPFHPIKYNLHQFASTCQSLTILWSLCPPLSGRDNSRFSSRALLLQQPVAIAGFSIVLVPLGSWGWGVDDTYLLCHTMPMWNKTAYVAHCCIFCAHTIPYCHVPCRLQLKAHGLILLRNTFGHRRQPVAHLSLLDN